MTPLSSPSFQTCPRDEAPAYCQTWAPDMVVSVMQKGTENTYSLPHMCVDISFQSPLSTLAEGVGKLVSLGRLLKTERVLINCVHGRSRSPAARLILDLAHTQAQKPLDKVDIDGVFETLYDHTPEAKPDILMLVVADKVMNLDDLLIQKIRTQI